MTYHVKEIFYTLQGEGANVGRPAVFCRFTACNLWTGREQDRSTAVCQFCDTDFLGTNGPGGGTFRDADALAEAVDARWPLDAPDDVKFVVCTGGEPLLQLDEAAVQALHARDFTVAIETNGTRTAPPGIDWICVSPKSGADLILRSGDELKLVFPQAGSDPQAFADMQFRHFFLQPMDGDHRETNTRGAIEYCLAHPKWRLSIQTHKLLGLP